MTSTFYFYDLETSGISSRTGRVMQFAGQRTDMNLRPVGEPDNILIKMSDDVLPDPDAILITGITPQKTRADGITEAEFLRYFTDSIATPGTIFTGFNNVRFDDEFMRFMLYRNFYDAYEWSWKDSRSRWDLLDVIRMTRALRPEGISWPFDSAGKPSNRLELLTSVNKLEHTDAHDALSDVMATIAVARLIRNKQTKLFDFLLGMRHKQEVKKFIAAHPMFLYASGKYASIYQKTTVVQTLGDHPAKQGVLVYDLRTDPDGLKAMTSAELAKAWTERVEDETKRFPVKTLQFNRCPAIAPVEVLKAGGADNISLDMNKIEDNRRRLANHPDIYDRLLDALKVLDKQRQPGMLADRQAVDTQLYDGFFDDQDRTAMSVVRAAEPDEVGSLDIAFQDDRLNELLPLYKARNFLDILTTEEREQWEAFRFHKLMDGGQKSLASKFFIRLGELTARPGLTSEQQYLLQELQLYGESILPSPDL